MIQFGILPVHDRIHTFYGTKQPRNLVPALRITHVDMSDLVIRDGECVPGKKMYLSVSIDHRLVDGATGAHWMNVVKDHLEQPYRMLLG